MRLWFGKQTGYIFHSPKNDNMDDKKNTLHWINSIIRYILCPHFFDWYSIREKVCNSIFIFRAISLTLDGKPQCFLNFLPFVSCLTK
jgi:hypothetical protein